MSTSPLPRECSTNKPHVNPGGIQTLDHPRKDRFVEAGPLSPRLPLKLVGQGGYRWILVEFP